MVVVVVVVVVDVVVDDTLVPYLKGNHHQTGPRGGRSNSAPVRAKKLKKKHKKDEERTGLALSTHFVVSYFDLIFFKSFLSFK